ncbi:MAG: hypothetical protein R2844_12885 [Caldilineales bacterium]
MVHPGATAGRRAASVAAAGSWLPAKAQHADRSRRRLLGQDAPAVQRQVDGLLHLG